MIFFITAEKSNKWEINDSYDSGPDGGYGWLVVVGSFFGILQAYFEENVFHGIPDAQFQLSFAGTIIGLMPNLMGPVFQILVARYGVRMTQIMGVFFMVLGLEMASFASKIWHLYFTQGFLFGLGAAFLYVSAMAIPPQWFNRRRGLGLGIVTSGSGIGGVILPFIMTSLSKNLGIAWTYRILGFIYLALNSITCILVKEKYPRNKKIKSADDGEEQPVIAPPTLKEIFDFSVLKDSTFVLWMVASMISTLGNFVPFFFLPTYATYHDLSSADGTTFMAVLAGSNCVGRVSLGFIGDRIGRLNAHIMSNLLSAVAAFGVWTVATTYASIMGFAVLYGLFCSSYYCLLSAITATIVGIDKFPTALSIMMLSNTFAVLGPSIASAIESNLDTNPYFSYKMFTGATFALGTFLLVLLKLKMTRSLLVKI
ncbi:major facilitator superfamily domain-containing protein [Phascolomyces articulosus]|uniref:Major facilitator superfamily domain-containing protein n=1 Tax=Phascolomyces articulosus TaxID=60185 RepID=A0AAD5PBF8_9FUNG|nr:major facilitator superfamily domain-containing protein [Phascolomyces articulosus]